jgi:signal transduction histidine kinase
MFGRSTSSLTGHAPSSWPVLLALLGAALFPSVCVLWFMQAAMSNEQLAMRQRLMDVFRQHLVLVRQQLDEQWTRKMQALHVAATQPAPVAFAQLVRNGVADAVVIRDDAGDVAYPVESVGSADVNVQAEALVGQARELVKKSDIAGAVQILERLSHPEFASARDRAGRLVAPNALLFALQLSPRNLAIQHQLLACATDYTSPPMPSSQRLMLLQEADRMTGKSSRLARAEELAAAYLDSNPPAAEPQLRRAMQGIWSLGIANSRMIALFRESSIRSAPTALPDTTVTLENQLNPGKPDPLLTVDAGPQFPAWRLALYSNFPENAGARTTLYLWTGVAVIALIVGMTLFVSRYVTAQVRLTNLKNDLMATVSHELRTPLASMRVLLDTLLAGRCTNLVQSDEYLRLIAKENVRLSRLIDNFLTFSRIERNKQQFEQQPLDLRQLVLDAADAMGDRFTAPHQMLDVAVPDSLPQITGDREALLTALLNLLDNAHKYTNDEKHVRLRASANGDEVVIEVSDNGIGIPPRAQRRIFDRFYQVDTNLSRKAGGCGLGLSIVHHIIRAHNGTIAVESAPEQGTTFTIRIPTPDASH